MSFTHSIEREHTGDRLGAAIRRAQANLLRLQHEDGHWCGELFVDSTLCSDYVLYMHWAEEVDAVLQEKCVAHIRRRQLADGGWNIYEDGPADENAPHCPAAARRCGAPGRRNGVSGQPFAVSGRPGMGK